MKNYVDVIGIDVSKLTIDAYMHKRGLHRLFTNNTKGFKELLNWANKHLGLILHFYCFENTGNYSLNLSIYLDERSIDYVEENPLLIKRSAGIVREKTDKLDSAMIARYAWLHREELSLSSVRDNKHQELGRLMALRDQLVRNRTGLMSSLKELKSLLSSPSTDVCCKSILRSISYITKQILMLEKRMKEIIKSDTRLDRNFKLLNSVRGIGLILSCQLLYHTSNFKRFNRWRQFSNYCGTAPFAYSSGTSVKRANKCHHIGDRKMKTLLSLASVSAIQYDSELRLYYKRKIEEGKPKLVALNNVRNKILARAFAVIKRGTPYVELHQYAA
ncbi:Transposase [Lutibacter agarilyticus]|uniref:Transposase n=1 Tax=Lutibacter agarilyticus TaxID=1109740 RepID=A0A238XN98_9FLAO|nr:IS110 family transposase [Lutibacter agarilyticus]SNR60170.1 Transposase [Lutibacter agarilyticus]